MGVGREWWVVFVCGGGEGGSWSGGVVMSGRGAWLWSGAGMI